MINKNLIKVVNLIVTVVGIGVSLTTTWVSDKKLELEIEEKIAKALANKA